MLALLTDALLRDLRYSARLFQRSPGFTSAAVLALGLGIGVNTAVYTAYKAMVARRPDARQPQQLVNLSLVRNSAAGTFTFSYLDYEAYRDSLKSFSGVLAFNTERMRFRTTAKPEDGSPILASVFVVSPNYFSVLDVEPVRGRGFGTTGVPSLFALISENTWEKRFACDPTILGRLVYLNGIGFTVIGITPRDFVGTSVAVPDFWLPVDSEPLVHADSNWLMDRENERYRLVGRLAPGANRGDAQAEMNVVANRLRALHQPHSDAAKPASAVVSPGSPFPLPLKMYPGLRFAILLIFGASAMVLIVACANVGGLQLARAQSRQSEIQTRLSLGAGRAHLIRQLLTESVVLGLLSGATALVCTWAFLKAAVFYGTRALPEEAGIPILDVAPDLGTILFVLLLSLVAGFLFGLAPALESSRAAIPVSSRNSTLGIRTRRLQDLFIAAQVALSLVLLITGSMLVRSALRSLELHTGYEANRLIQLELQFPESQKYKIDGQTEFVQELTRRLASIPTVQGITSARPPTSFSFQTEVSPMRKNKHQAPSALRYTYIEPNYFEVLGIPLFAGHTFSAPSGHTENSVILSRSAADRLWPGEYPIGHHLRLAAVDEKRHNSSEYLPTGPEYEVIGIARDTRGAEFDRHDSEQVFLPLPENLLPSRPILIRSAADPASIKKAIEPIASSVDPEVIGTASTLKELLRQTPPFITASLGAAIASLVGMVGLLLSLMGIYGTVSYIVALRTREIGIRIAIGAQRHHVLQLVLGQSTRPILAGMAAGIFLAMGASYLLRVVLYGLQLVDPLAFAGTSLAFLAIALAAAYRSSSRAMRVDPAVALRYE